MKHTPEQLFTSAVVDVLTTATGIQSVESLVGCFFLLSKSEHDNTEWEKTFLTADGDCVFFYAKALDYDVEQRGVTVGIAGWTTANGGRDDRGDFIRLAERYKRLGGLDLRPGSKGLTGNKAKARRFCRDIHTLHGDYADRWITAQIKELCSEDGYVYEAVKGLRDAGVSSPKALSVAIVMDTAVNQGFGGKWCPLKWLRNNASSNEEKLMTEFLAWKRVSATKNHHNSPPSNGRKRADMFMDLVESGDWDLARSACEKVVTWRMK
jgi:hypothetical protein